MGLLDATRLVTGALLGRGGATIPLGTLEDALEEDGIGGSQPLVGWAANWFGAGWTVSAGGFRWATTDFEPSGIDWDTDGFADSGSLPFFSPVVPADLGGIYLTRCSAVFTCETAGGFVGMNIGGSTRGTVWAPILAAADTDRQILQAYDLLNLDGEDNSADVANFINFGPNDVTLLRVDYWGVRIAPQPA